MRKCLIFLDNLANPLMTSDAITQYAKKRASIFRDKLYFFKDEIEREVKMFDEMRKTV